MYVLLLMLTPSPLSDAELRYTDCGARRRGLNVGGMVVILAPSWPYTKGGFSIVVSAVSASCPWTWRLAWNPSPRYFVGVVRA